MVARDRIDTVASLLGARGVSAEIAASLLGHDPAVYARTYRHVYDVEQRDAIDRLGSALSGG